MNTTSDNMTYLVDLKNPRQHNKLHSLTDRRVKWISETMYKEIERSFIMTNNKNITSECGDDLSDQKKTNFDIEYDQFCCSDCTKLLYLKIKIK